MKKIYMLVFLLLSMGSILNAESTVYDRVFRKAFFKDDVKKMTMAINKGADVNRIDYRNIYKRPLNVLKLLVDNNYNLNDNSRGCILSEFFNDRKISNDFFKSIKFLLDKGANPDCLDESKISVVQAATAAVRKIRYQEEKQYTKEINEFIKTYQFLINKASKYSINRYYEKIRGDRLDYKFKPLSIAKYEDKRVFKILIEAGTNINEPTHYTSSNKPSDTPLEIAIFKDNPELIKLVLKMGGDINLVYDTLSPIDYAHQNGKDNAEIYLLENAAKYVKYPKLN